MRTLWVALLMLSCAHRSVAGGGGDNSYTPQKELELGARPLHGTERLSMVRQGFAFSPETARSFHFGYMGVFHAHQPVFISADATLQAWHASYDAMLQTLEYQALIPTVRALLKDLNGSGNADLDRYLDVAEALLNGTGGDDPLIKQARSAQGQTELKLFDTPQLVDFSMFKPRGHYTKSPELSQYFQAMVWLGRVELRLANKDHGSWVVDHRALAAAKALAKMSTPERVARWKLVDDTLGELVGPGDSMTLPQLVGGASAANVIEALAPVAKQRIRTQLQVPGAETISFLLFGSRFVFDSEIFTHLTYGSLKEYRLMPSPLDVAHTLLRNPAARPLLEPEVKQFGEEYANALEAERARADEDPTLWTSSVYHQWLRALRELSPDAKRDAALPKPFQSDAWSRRMMNTQLASWAELRHDNILYAKQSGTAMVLCEFPDAYVDPYPGFFHAMEQIAQRGLSLVQRLPLEPHSRTWLARWLSHMHDTHARLAHIAERERANLPIEAGDLEWINHMVAIDPRNGGCVTVLEPVGWYSDLFLNSGDAMWTEPVVADVHTQPTDEAGTMVGRVLHVGTWLPRMMTVTVEHDGGAHRQTYRGFVSSYEEKTTSDFYRYNDDEWRSGHPGQPPEWLKALSFVDEEP